VFVSILSLIAHKDYKTIERPVLQTYFTIYSGHFRNQKSEIKSYPINSKYFMNFKYLMNFLSTLKLLNNNYYSIFAPSKIPRKLI